MNLEELSASFSFEGSASVLLVVISTFNGRSPH